MLSKSTVLAAAWMLVAAGVWSPGACAAEAPAATPAPSAETSRKLDAGLPAVQRLLQLMDADANGKVSKDEFMRFMEAEFDKADVNHDNELDPKELSRLVQSLTHPVRGPAR